MQSYLEAYHIRQTPRITRAPSTHVQISMFLIVFIGWISIKSNKNKKKSNTEFILSKGKESEEGILGFSLVRPYLSTF